MTTAVEATLVLESYNLAEGGSEARLRAVLDAAVELVERHGAAELLLTDADGGERVAALLERDYPSMRRVDARGLGYDDAKMKGAAEARGEFVLFLDGDCIPNAGWLDAHLEGLRAGAVVTSGFTRYEGGLMAAVATVLDFGFLLPLERRRLGCYASNNSGFRRDALLATPMPDGEMRCRCYAHAQELARRGTPAQLVPGARNDHEPQPFLPERLRQGYDVVAACWSDPLLPEARLLRLGPLAAPLFYARSVAFDWQRLRAGRRDLGLSVPAAAAALALFPLLRLVDLVGMLRALLPGGRSSRLAGTGFAAQVGAGSV